MLSCVSQDACSQPKMKDFGNQKTLCNAQAEVSFRKSLSPLRIHRKAEPSSEADVRKALSFVELHLGCATMVLLSSRTAFFLEDLWLWA